MKAKHTVPLRHYPTVAGLLEIILGFICLYVSVPGLMQAAGGAVSSQTSGLFWILGFSIGTFGIVASVFGFIGGISSLSRRNFSLSAIGSYLMLMWYASWLIGPLTANTLVFGTPATASLFPSSLLELLAFVTVFAILFLLPSSLGLILIRKSKAEFP